VIRPIARADAACGGKAARLGALHRAGFAVPEGFVVLAPVALEEATQLLADLGGPVAVRSSGLAEDSAHASFAGQLETVLGVVEPADVVAAVERCAASGAGDRVRQYAEGLGSAPGSPAASGEDRTPVIVQRLVAAEVAGVAFSMDPVGGAESVVIDASWGLGESVVSGRVVPDTFRVPPDGAETGGTVPVGAAPVTSRVGSKASRLDLVGTDLRRTPVALPDRVRPCLAPGQVAAVAELARAAEGLLGGPQDIEWAVAGEELWMLQSRPVTALRAPTAVTPAEDPPPATVLATGAPASPGRVRGPARLVHGVDGFGTVRVGDVLVCRTTDPAWTPLFRMVSAVVTETGGPLSHASIVAREFGIPAIVGAAGAMGAVTDGRTVVVDGTRGTMALPDD